MQPNDYIPTMTGKFYDDKVFLFTQQINGRKITYDIEEAIVLFTIMEHLEIKTEIKIINEFNNLATYNLR